MAKTPEPSPARRRSLLWIGPAVTALIVLVVVCTTTGVRAIEVFIGGAVDLFGIALWLAGGWGIGNLLTARLLSAHDALLRHVTSCAIGIGLMGLAFHALGLAGALSGMSVATVVIGGVIAAASSLRNKKLTLLPAPCDNGELLVHIAGWTLVAFPLALAIVAASVSPGYLWNPLDPHPYDVMSYHLQVPREWFDAKRIIPLDHNAFSFFPMLMETHYLAAMHAWGGPWDAMYLCQFISLTHGVLTCVAVYAIVRSLFASPILAWIATVLCATTPWVMMLSGVCYIETGVLLYTTLALGWIIIGTTWRTALVVGACLGLACGMKYTAFAMSGAVVLVAWLVSGKPTRQRLVHMLIAGAMTALIASPWLIRNFAWTGNPVFPLATSVFGRGHFTPEQVERYEVAHRPPEKEASVGSRLSIGAKRTLGDVQFGYVLLPLAIVGGALVLVRWRDGRVLVLSIIGMTLVWLFATHVMPRFLTPIIPLSTIAVAGAIASLPKKWVAAASTGALMLVLLQTGLGVAWTATRLMDRLGGGGVVLVRLDDWEDEDIASIRRSGGKLALVGEAQAFIYRFPSDRLRYRTVFDVHGEGWLGESIDDLRREGYWVMVNPPELARLSLSYRHITPDAGVEPRMPYLLRPIP